MKMKRITFEDFKKIYKDYYKIIVDLLIKNGVPFSCACGTMLGAIRNKDIIEWDYDIDNFFFIDDINKLLSIEKYLPKNLYFETYLNGKLRYGLVRICFKNIFRHNEKSTRYTNVFIDFFAIKNVNITEKRRAKIYSNVLKEEKKIAFKYCKYKSKNLLKACLKKIYQFLLPSSKYSSNKIEKITKHLKDGNTCIMCRNCRLVSTKKIDRDDIKLVQFGDFQIPCYSNSSEILSSLFGNDWETPKKYEDRFIPEFYIEN